MIHTSGPWKYDPLRGITADDCLIIGRAVTEVRDAIEQEANMKLIAAAPELLESIRALLEVCSCPNNCPPEDLTCATNVARAAIAKATGEQK